MALIYLVEDDPSIREIEEISLKNSNYVVKSFENGKEFLDQTESVLPDLVVLDIMLPDIDGNDIVKQLRRNPATRRLPVIMVTAKSTEMDLVRALNEGADDYIKKPFSIMELLSRVKALLRRASAEEPKSINIGSLYLDYERHKVLAGDDPIELTYKEFELLRYLMINAGTVLSREAIMRFVWDTEFEGETRTVDMHVKTLRQKLGDYGQMIKTVRNVGYVMQEKGEN